MSLETKIMKSSTKVTLGATLLSAALAFSGCDNNRYEPTKERDGGASTVVPAYNGGSTIIYSRPGMTFVPDTPASHYSGTAGKGSSSSATKWINNNCMFLCRR